MSLPPQNLLAIAISALAALIVGSMHAAGVDIKDTFDRAATVDVPPGDIPNPIGTQYTIVGGTWCLKTKKGVTYLMATNPGVMYENTIKTDSAKRFTMSADVLIGGPSRKEASGPRNGGLVFHYIDAENYCALVYRVYEGANDDVFEVLKVKDGKLSSLGSVKTLNLSTSTFYTMMLESSVDGEPGKYRFSLSDQGGKEPIYSDTFTDASLPEGYSGFIRQGSASILFSNYSLQTAD